MIDPRCALTIVIPAKNEEALIGRALAAIVAQVDDVYEAPLESVFDVIVSCNDCDDDTARVARRFAREHPLRSIAVIETALPRDAAHVGTARRAVLDLAVRRFLDAEMPHGIVASTDADTIVAPTWVSATMREMRNVDAVAGHVTIDPAERHAMPEPLRIMYDRELAYRRLIGEIQTRFDPLPYEATPRHDAFVGASFAVSARAYVAAGGIAPLPLLEDRAFSEALDRIDARVRHSYDVRASTSARTVARVDGGFSTLLERLNDLGRTRLPYLVRSARCIRDEARARGLARAFWIDRTIDADTAELARLARIDEHDLVRAANRARTFGAFWSAVRKRAFANRSDDEPVEHAIRGLRRALAVRPTSFAAATNVATGTPTAV